MCSTFRNCTPCCFFNYKKTLEEVQKDIIITTRKEAGVPVKAVYDLLMESNRQWWDRGLRVPFLENCTQEEFEGSLQRANVFVAKDRETGELLGVHAFRVDRKRNCVIGFDLAISPKAKRQGIATRMLEMETERIRKAGFDYIEGITTIAATWSVRWHLKNGYRIVGYKRPQESQQAVYVFRKQIAPSLLYSTPFIAPVVCKIRYLLSYLATCIAKHQDGRLTTAGRIGKKLVAMRNA